MIVLVIPARYGSQRLPAKMLRPLAGVPLVVRTAQNASRAPYPLLVAHDDERIGAAVRAAGFEALATRAADDDVALAHWLSAEGLEGLGLTFRPTESTAER